MVFFWLLSFYDKLVVLPGEGVEIVEAALKPGYLEAVVRVEPGASNRLGRVAIVGKWRIGGGSWKYTYNIEPRGFLGRGLHRVRWYYEKDGLTEWELKKAEFEVEGRSFRVPGDVKNPCVFIVTERDPYDLSLTFNGEEQDESVIFLEAGNYEIEASKSGYVSDSYSCTAEKGDVFEVRVKLKYEKPKKPHYHEPSVDWEALLYSIGGFTCIGGAFWGEPGAIIGGLLGLGLYLSVYIPQINQAEERYKHNKNIYEEKMYKWEHENPSRFGLKVTKL